MGILNAYKYSLYSFFLDKKTFEEYDNISFKSVFLGNFLLNFFSLIFIYFIIVAFLLISGLYNEITYLLQDSYFLGIQLNFISILIFIFLFLMLLLLFYYIFILFHSLLINLLFIIFSFKVNFLKTFKLNLNSMTGFMILNIPVQIILSFIGVLVLILGELGFYLSLIISLLPIIWYLSILSLIYSKVYNIEESKAFIGVFLSSFLLVLFLVLFISFLSSNDFFEDLISSLFF